MKSIYLIPVFMLFLFSCKLDKVENPNSADPNVIGKDPSQKQLNFLVSGIEASTRNQHAVYCYATGTVARELYLFNSDPRNTGDLLGKNTSTIDNNTFYLTGPYSARYICVKTANLLIEFADKSTDVNDKQKEAYKGFANTIKAHQLLMVLNMLGKNGIRVDVADEEKLGPFLTGDKPFEEISKLLDKGHEQLKNGEILFTLSLGFLGFQDNEGLMKFNRALAARVAAYRGKWDDVLEYLDNSFYEFDGELTLGPKHIFSPAAKDVINTLYKVPGNTGDMIFAHANYSDGGDYFESDKDERLKKFYNRETTITNDGLDGKLETRLFTSLSSSIDIIRNEELIFLYGEANLQKGNTGEFLKAINRIRNYYGLDDYSGPNDKDDLIEEFLNQKRYSFWCEGHMIVDYRRYGKLNSDYLPIDRKANPDKKTEADDVFTEFPIPLTEG